LTPADYLALSPRQAQAQFQQVLARPRVRKGRGENFTPVETLLCVAASLVVNHRRYGGTTAHLAGRPVQELARLFRRTPASVLAKMANLDGSRPNGARHEVTVASELLDEPADLAQLGELYRVVFAAARSSGVDHTELPDFLDLERPGSRLLLAGQEELVTSEVESSVEPQLRRWAVQLPGLDSVETERLLVGAVRVGQHRFAGQVLANHRHRCGFCGLHQLTGRPGVRGLLVASHIKPWKASQGKERLDPRNGVAACPTHDVAFDTGLITLADDRTILLSPLLVRAVADDPAAAAVFGRPPLSGRLILPPGGDLPELRYLGWHRANVYAAAA